MEAAHSRLLSVESEKALPFMTGPSSVVGTALLALRYAQVLDQNRLDAMKKLEELKKSAITGQQTAESAADQPTDGLRQ